MLADTAGRRTIKLDGVSFIDNVIEAFGILKKELSSNSSLARNVIEAEKHGEKIFPPKAVSNQFNAVYSRFKK